MSRTSSANRSSENATDSSVLVPSKAEGIAWCSVFILISIFIVAGNLLTIVLFVLNKNLRKKSLFLVINMAFADLMLGALSLPGYIFSIGGKNQLWTEASIEFAIVYRIIDTIFSQVALISAAFISTERLYAIYWPFKHRTLTVRTYRIVLGIVWTLAALISAVFLTLLGLISFTHSVYVWTPYTLILILVLCGCHIGIWRKFRHGRIASQQESKALQNKRLTKTLMLVSTLVLLSWIPLILLNSFYASAISIPWRYFNVVNILNYSNSFVNPIVYAFKIPEFKQAFLSCCVGRQAAPNMEDIKRRNKMAPTSTSETQLRTLRTDPGHLQLPFKQEAMDTKL